MRSRLVTLAALSAALLAAACGGGNTDHQNTSNGTFGPPEYDAAVNRTGSIFGGDGGINLFGNDKKSGPGDQGGGIGVNSFLWRATLDTLSFMPLASADPFGGVIITDWYSPPESPNERFKVNVFILDRQLRADGVRAAVFRQAKSAAGGWVDQSVESTTQTNLENAILVRARQLRVSTQAARQ